MDRTAAQVADMALFVRELRAVAAGKQLAQVLGDRILCLAIEKLFINLGEAAKRIPPEKAAQIPGVEWVRLIGLRNILAHGYEQIAHEVLFRSIEQDLPPLEAALVRWLDGVPPP